MKKIYLASSFANDTTYEMVRDALLAAGHDLFDFKSNSDTRFPPDGHYSDPAWNRWTPTHIRDFVVNDPKARQCFNRDRFALIDWCDCVVLCTPCGRSAHLELGVAAGMGKVTVVYLGKGTVGGELMWLCADAIVTDLPSLLSALTKQQKPKRRRPQHHHVYPITAAA